MAADRRDFCDLAADSLPRGLWRLHLVGGEVESVAAPVDVELDVFSAAVDGDYRVRVYRMAFVDGAVCDAWNV